MALSLTDLQNWLTAGNLNAGQIVVNWMPDSPDAVVVPSAVGPGPVTFEGAFVSVPVIIRVRATTDAAAETAADAVFEYLVVNESSFHMGSTYVLTIEVEGQPMFLGRDTTSRSVYSVSAHFTVAA